MGSRIGGGAGDDDVISEINITPFVDIILVVLIIFMVTATTIVESSIKVELPEAATGEGSEETSLGLMLQANGGILLDGQPVTAEGLRDALRAARAVPGAQVECLIAADKGVAWGRMVWLLDLIRSEKIGKYQFQIDKINAVPPDPAAVGP
jgi:biopolymer transport protein ExbD